jgi:hypothetical protein
VQTLHPADPSLPALGWSEIVVPAWVVVPLFVALFHLLERAFGLLARLVWTEPVGDLGVIVVGYDRVGLQVEPPIALRHLKRSFRRSQL